MHIISLKTEQVAGLMTQTLVSVLANIGRYIVPMICLADAEVSFLRRKQCATLVRDIARAENAIALNGMSWGKFELLVGETYRLQGYSVIETGGDGADGGIDLHLAKNGEKFLVQCKQWKTFKVGVEVVRDLYGTMAASSATGEGFASPRVGLLERKSVCSRP